MKLDVSFHLAAHDNVNCINGDLRCKYINHAADSRRCALNHRRGIPIELWNMVDVKPVMLGEQQLQWMDSVNISTSELQQAARMIPRYLFFFKLKLRQ